jgi:hypothetical protein
LQGNHDSDDLRSAPTRRGAQDGRHVRKTTRAFWRSFAPAARSSVANVATRVTDGPFATVLQASHDDQPSHFKRLPCRSRSEFRRFAGGVGDQLCPVPQGEVVAAERSRSERPPTAIQTPYKGRLVRFFDPTDKRSRANGAACFRLGAVSPDEEKACSSETRLTKTTC